MAKKSLEHATEERGKNENIKERSTPSLTASQVYLAFVQTLNLARNQTSQDQLAALQSMIQYIRNVGYWYGLFSLYQKAELREVEDLKPEGLNAEKIIALVVQYIGYLTSMISTPEEREDVSKAPPKLSASPARANERGDYTLMIEKIEKGIASCGEVVFSQFREIVQTLESKDNIYDIFGNIVEFSALITPMSITPITHHDLYRRLKGVRFHTFLIALITLNDDNKNNHELQNGIAEIISSLSDSFMKTLRKNLKKCGHNDLPVANRHQLLRLLAQEIQVKVLQRPPEPVAAPVKADYKAKKGTKSAKNIKSVEDTKTPDPRKPEWMTHQTLTLQEVYAILYPEGSLIPKGTTMFKLAISALARYLPLPKKQWLSVNNLLDWLTEEFKNPELSCAIEDAIEDEIKKDELKEEEIIKLIVEDEEGAKQSKLLKELKQQKEFRRLKQLKLPIKLIPQRKQNNSDPTT